MSIGSKTQNPKLILIDSSVHRNPKGKKRRGKPVVLGFVRYLKSHQHLPVPGLENSGSDRFAVGV